MIDHSSDIGRTFNDYEEDSDIHFIKLHIENEHFWCGKTLSQLKLPPDLLVAMIVRKQEIIIPNGATVLEVGDLLVLAARSFEDREHLKLQEYVVDNSNSIINKPLSSVSQVHTNRIIIIKRGIDTIIPDGDTILKPGDIVVTAKASDKKNK